MFFQYASEDQFRETVERLTERKVWAFVSGIDTQRDVSSEIFYLEPIGDDGEPRAAASLAGRRDA
jgi:hypothetical protein